MSVEPGELQSSVFKRREPSCPRAATVSDGEINRNDPSHRRPISAAHARCNAPVDSIPITGGPSTPLATIYRSSSSTPARNTGNDTGSPINPRSPEVSQAITALAERAMTFVPTAPETQTPSPPPARGRTRSPSDRRPRGGALRRPYDAPVPPEGTSAVPLGRRVELLRGAGPLAAVDDEALRELAAVLHERTVPAGTVLLREGEPGDALLVLVAGEAELTTEGRWGPVELARLGPGAMVGEGALVFPGGLRSATVTSVGAMSALVLERKAFDAFLAADSARSDAFGTYAEELQVARFVREVPALASLPDARRRALATTLVPWTVEAGETIVAAGVAADACHLLRSGRAEVLEPDGSPVMIGPGDIVGEREVLSRAAHGVSVLARERCELLTLRAEDLRALMGAEPEAAEQLLLGARLRSRPRRVEGVVAVERRGPDDTIVVTLHNPARNTYFRLGPGGRFVWDRLDGRATLRELTLAHRESFGVSTPSIVTDTVVALARAGMADDVPVADDLAATPSTRTQAVIRRLRPLLFRAIWFRGVDRSLERLHRRLGRHLASRPVLAGLGLVAVVGLVVFALGLLDGTRGLERRPELAAFVLPAWLGATLVHELAHGVAVKAFGRKVAAGGIGLFWLRPVAFVDTSDMWLGSRRERAAVSLAGPFSGLVLSGLLSTGALIAGEGPVGTVLWAMALPILIGVLVNMAPFLELDGYHVLCEVLDRPNLRADAVAALTARLGVGPRVRIPRVLLVYAVVSLAYLAAFVVLVITQLRHVVEQWLSGLLSSGAATAVAFVVVLPPLVILLAGVADEHAGVWRARQRGTNSRV